MFVGELGVQDLAQRPGERSRTMGSLQVRWSPDVESCEDDGLFLLLDGFLLPGVGVTLEDVAGRLRRSPWPEVAADLRGSFSLLVWDVAADRGAVACDHLSMRPCYVHGDGSGAVRFATALPELRRVIPRAPGPDPLFVASWLAPLHGRGHGTALEGVRRVGAARMVHLAARQAPAYERYWRPAYRPPLDGAPEELVGLVRDAVQRAVALRVAGDPGPVGVALSGGLDSSLVLGVANALEDGPSLRTYSAVFPGWPPADETIRIRRSVEALGVPSRRVRPEPQGVLRVALEFVRDTGGPLIGPGLVVERPGLEQAAADGVRLILDGQGGDETFGHSMNLLADRARRGDLPGIVRLLRQLPDRPAGVDVGMLRRVLADYAIKPNLPRRLRRRVDVPARAWLTDRLARELAQQPDPEPWRRDGGGPLWWQDMAYTLFESREASGLADYTWQRGAPLGLRSASALLDVDLGELMLRMRPAIAWQPRSRPLARAAAAGLVPDQVRLARRKANLGPFYLDALKGPDNAIMRELLLDPRARIREWMPGDVLTEHTRRMPDRTEADWLIWTTVQWRMISLELWLRWLEDPGWLDGMLERTDLPHAAGTVLD